MVSFISFVFAATINKLPLTKRERGFISAFLPTAAPADKGLGRCDHSHIFNNWLNESPISDWRLFFFQLIPCGITVLVWSQHFLPVTE